LIHCAIKKKFVYNDIVVPSISHYLNLIMVFIKLLWIYHQSLSLNVGIGLLDSRKSKSHDWKEESNMKVNK